MTQTNKLNKLTNGLSPMGLVTKLRPYVLFSALNTVWRRLDKSSKTILDVGCGKGEPMAFINRQGKFRVVGIDIFRPYLEQARKKFYVLRRKRFLECHSEEQSDEESHIYTNIILGDARYLPFKDKSFDAVICMEVLEHFEKEEGEKLLEELDRVARRQILVSTPVGKYEQHPFDGNPRQEHKHIWQVKELKERSYKIKGAGIKGLPREEINSRFLRLLREALYVVGGFFSYNFSRIACHMVAEKSIMKEKQN